MSHVTSYQLHYVPISSLSKTSSFSHGNQLSLSSVRPKKAIGRRGFTIIFLGSDGFLEFVFS